MWTARSEALDGGRTIRTELLQGGGPVSWGRVIGLWQEDAAFRDFFVGLLASAPQDACFWETPPAIRAGLDRPFAFALTDSPALAGVSPDPSAFAGKFAADPAEPVAAFGNFGGDAILIAPAPRGPIDAYPHLAVFARAAGRPQQHAFWRRVGQEVAARLSDAPLWVSTSGLGVPWLHVRLDATPKYYAFAPFRACA